MLPEGGESPPELFLPGLARGAAGLGLVWDERSLDLLARYLARLDAARRRTNLTGPFPSEELIAHAVESALGADLVPPGPAADIGSGAGFPGVVVAILRPDVEVIPVEPRRLRREFLDGCGRELPIPNLAAALSSVKLLPRGSVSAVLARAVGGVEGILGGAEFVRPRGVFLAWTTQPQVAGLRRALAPSWALEQAIPVPGAERKQIAVFRHR